MKLWNTIIAAAILFALCVSSVLAADGDPTKMGNSTAVTSTIGGTTGNLSVNNATVRGNLYVVGSGYINASQICTAGNGICSVGGSGGGNVTAVGSIAGRIGYYSNTTNLNSSTLNQTSTTNVTSLGNFTVNGDFSMVTYPVSCPGNNTFMTQFTGLTSVCTQLNLSALNFVQNCGAGTVVQNITANGIQCVTDQTGAGGSFSNGSTIYVASPFNITGTGTNNVTATWNGSGMLWRWSLQDSGANMKLLNPSSSTVFQCNKDTNGCTIQNLIATSSYNGAVALTATGASGMTVNIAEFKNSSGSVLASVMPNGTINASKGIVINETTCTNGLLTRADGTVYCSSTAGGSGAMTKVNSVTFSNSNNTQYIIAQGNVSASCQAYMICVNFYQNSSSAQGALGIRVNDVSAGSYKSNRVAYSTLSNPSTDTSFQFQASGTGTNDYSGCVTISRATTAQADLMATGPIASSDQVIWFGGRVASGTLTNASIGMYNASTSSANANLTGTAVAYCLTT